MSVNTSLTDSVTASVAIFQQQIKNGIPDFLPSPKPYDQDINHAPKRKDILSKDEKKLALRNALRYFDAKFHKELIQEFSEELDTYGRIYQPRIWTQT